MAVRTALLLSFIAGTIFGAAVLWLFQEPGGANEANTADSELTEADAGSTRNSPEECCEELERASYRLARERETVVRLSAELEKLRPSPGKSLADPVSRKSYQAIGFYPGVLRMAGFSPDDIAWIRDRWEQAEIEKRYLADRVALGDDLPENGGFAEIERELREDLGEGDYDAMLYATHQNNRVALMRLRNNSLASQAGISEGSVVWSYDGQRIFRPDELATLSTTGARGEDVEIVIITDGETQRHYIGRNPLGADLVGAKGIPDPN